MGAGTLVGIVLGGMIGVLLGALIGWLPATLGLGVVIGGAIGHLVSPAPDARARPKTDDGDRHGGDPGYLGFMGAAEGSSDAGCGDIGSDGGSCGDGGADGGGGGH